MNMQIRDLVKVMAVDGQGDHQCEQPGAMKECPEKGPPILESLSAEDSQSDARTEESVDTVDVEGGFHSWRFIMSQKRPKSPVILLMGINMAQYVTVTLSQ
jgi:hypothetical protein